MGVFSLLGFLLIGALAGWLAARLVQGKGYGLWGNMAIGVLGAVIGGTVLVRGLGFSLQPAGFLSAFLGAVILLALVSVVRRSRS